MMQAVAPNALFLFMAGGVSQVDSETSNQAGGSMPLINTMAIDTLDKNYRKQDTGKVP